MSLQLEEKPKTTLPWQDGKSAKHLFEYKYRWQLGMIAWALHRLSGLALIFYLCLHIYVIHNLAFGASRFNEVMKMVGSPMFKVLEIGLLGVILYHAFNGIRIVIVDFWGGAKIHKKLFWAMMCVAAALFVAGAVPMTGHLLRMLRK